MRLLIFLLLFPAVCFGQITKPGVNVQNGGTAQGRATTVNCDGTTTTCTMSGSVVTLSSAGGSSGNVGIGTAIPNPELVWSKNNSLTGVLNSGVDSNGNIGIGTNTPTSYLYVTGATPATATVNATSSSYGIDASTVLAAPLNNNVTDYSSTGATITNQSVSFQNSVNKFGGYNGSFPNTSSDYLTAPQISAYNLSGNFTIGFWYYPLSTSASFNYGFIGNQNTHTGGNGWALLMTNSEFCFNANNTAIQICSGAETANQWYWVEVQRSGSTITLYVNGSSVNSGSYGSAINSVLNLYIGLDPSGFYPANGYIQDAFISTALESTSVPTQRLGSTSGISSLSLTVNKANPAFIQNSATDSNNLEFGTGTTTQMALTTGGNLGIGTTTVPNVLYVAGTAEMQGFKMNNAPTNNYVLTSDANGVGTWQAAAGGSNYWSLTAGAGNVGISTTNTVGIGTTSASSGAGLVVMNGNVGIGTWVPNNLLTLGSSASPSWNSAYQVMDMFGRGFFYGSSNGTGWSGTGYGQTEWGNNTVFTSGGVSKAVGTGASSTILQGTGQISFSLAPSVSAGSTQTFLEAMHIDNSGNIGIGTSTSQGGLVVTSGNVGIGTWVPNGALNVQGGNVVIGAASPLNSAVMTVIGSTSGNNMINFENTSSSGYSAQAFYSSGGVNEGVFGYGNSSVSAPYTSNVYMGSVPSTPVIFVTDATERMRLDQNGNVGIGTSTPVAGLSVMNGNVGIGTWVPAQALDVVGGLRLSTGNIYAPNNSGTAAQFGNGNNLFWGTTERFYDAAGDAEWMRITNGNVGIGTLNPGYSLDTAGGIRALGSGTSYFGSNVGIGSLTPQAALVVQNGDIRSIGTAPACSSCGTCSVVGTDNAFTVSVGVSTTCTATFNTTKTNAPVCVCRSQSTGTSPTCTTSTSAETCSVVVTGDKLDCVCIDI